jgi:hypothetical protein
MKVILVILRFIGGLGIVLGMLFGFGGLCLKVYAERKLR